MRCERLDGEVELPFLAREALSRPCSARRVQSIVRHAYGTVPFYRDAMDERACARSDFRRPRTSPSCRSSTGWTVQEELDRFLSSAYADEGSRTASYTSGCEALAFAGRSTGTMAREPGCWRETSGCARSSSGSRATAVARYCCETSWASSAAAALRRKTGEAARPDPDGDSLDGDDPHVHLVVGRRAPPGGSPDRHYELSPLLPFEEVVERLNEVRPRLVISFGSFADLVLPLARRVGGPTSTSRACGTTPPTASAPGVKDLAAERGCTLHSSYQTVEAGLIGFECERCDGHHLSVDLCALTARRGRRRARVAWDVRVRS